MAKPHRISHFSYLGPYRYFLPICAKTRLTAFLDDDVATQTIGHFLITATDEAFAVLAYCLMPDHMHLLVEGMTDESDFKRFVKIARQRSGFGFARTAGHRLWQDDYFERVLRQDEDAKAIARYILENPVRAGIVEWPTTSRHLGSSVWDSEALLQGTART